MARKPVNEITRLQTRDAIWDAIRTFQGDFTVRQIQQETRCTINQTGEYIKGLTAAGILELVGYISGNGFIKPTKVYKLIQDRGVEAPRVRRDGTEVTQGRGREQMWETMRSSDTFTATDIHVFASTDDHAVALGEAKTYCQFLCRAGYLKQFENGSYTLVNRTGPKPPMIQRIKQVYDPNLNRVVWSEGDDHDAK
ncbi:MAG: hypothetical protein L3J57_14810 [Desulfuromusa sp.]|nr:hypothetical protein [Desulfuromusa sp.]